MSSTVASKKIIDEQRNEIDRLSAQVKELSAQIKWFQNQLFGQKSERRIPEVPGEQLFLGEQFQDKTASAETETVKEHKRKRRQTKSHDGDNEKLFKSPDPG